jgi:N-carbamoyl-L-amino-acid hydrolase
MTESASLRINSQRLWQSLQQMATIGATEKGGVCRLALSDLDRQSRDLFVEWARQAGCTIHIDRIGNIFARRPGMDPLLPPVLTGSHADTQPTGGRFDGIYGVLAGLEVMRTLQDHHIQTRHPLELVLWTNEEGARFAPAMIGSAVFTGASTLEYALSRQDETGQTQGEALETIAYAGPETPGHALHAAFELHIEQGPILEMANRVIGVVTGAQGQRWYEVSLTGTDSHAGTTPMTLRRDALLGLARLVTLVNELGQARAPDARATVGMVRVSPNSRNVIPGHAWLTIEFRHPDSKILAEMDHCLRVGLEQIAASTGLEASLEQIFSYAPVPFDPVSVHQVRTAVEQLGYSHQEMISGAGHDACHLARVTPTAMIFIPCIGGLSHNEAEDIYPEWAEAGANVLLHSLLAAAH